MENNNFLIVKGLSKNLNINCIIHSQSLTEFCNHFVFPVLVNVLASDQEKIRDKSQTL